MSSLARQNNNFVLEYDLLSLPTAQHKAGLAGLLVHLESLRLRDFTILPKTNVTPTQATLVITPQTLQILFDDLYNTHHREIASSKRWKGKEPKRIEEREVTVTGKTKTKKFLIYDVMEPRGQFLQTFFPDGDGVWMRLWRDMLWNILREKPKKRLVYQERDANQPSFLSSYFWEGFEKAYSSQKKGKAITDKISSSIFLGAEDVNPERVPFRGTWQDNFLLHFWPLASLIFVPRTIDLERSKDRGLRVSRQRQGFVLAIPEPINLLEFRDDLMNLLKSLDCSHQVGVPGVPKAALIDLLDEGALEYLYHFVHQKIHALEIKFSLCAVELYHMVSKRNRVRQLAAHRFLPNTQIIRDYEQVRDRTANPLFKLLNLTNLLSGKPWYVDAFSLFEEYPWPLFIFTRGQTPREVRFFGRDVRQRFSNLRQIMLVKQQGGLMGEKEKDNQIALRIYRLVQAYVNHRTEEKSGKRFQDFQYQKDDKNRIIYPKEYRDAREKVCSDAFLAMRSRRDQDFIDYFAGAVCSVPHFLPEKEFVMVANALMDDWARIRILAMMALSAQSYLPGT